MDGVFDWPSNRKTVKDPQTGVPMCQDCWNGMHKRGGCSKSGCQCGCYHGRSKQSSGPRLPAKGLAPNLPDVGGFEVR